MLDNSVTMQSEDAMQAAVELVWTTTEDTEQFALATARAQVLVSMARELRLGKAKTRKYGDIQRPNVQPPHPPGGSLLLEIGTRDDGEEPEPLANTGATTGPGVPPQNVVADPSATGAP